MGSEIELSVTEVSYCWHNLINEGGADNRSASVSSPVTTKRPIYHCNYNFYGKACLYAVGGSATLFVLKLCTLLSPGSARVLESFGKEKISEMGM